MKKLLVALLLAAWVLPSYGVGFGGGLWVDTLDVSDTKGFLIQFMEEEVGVPPEELGDIEAELEQVPNLLPVPMPGGFLSIDVGFGALELEGAYLSDSLLRQAAGLPSGPIPITEEDDEVEITADPRLEVYRVALGWHPRFDVGLFAAGVGVGAALTGGGLEVDFDSPDPEVGEFLSQIEIEEGTFSWSAGGPVLWADLELGLPFLRLFARGHLFLPLFSSTGDAQLHAGYLGAAAGLVIRL
ncbi:MAG: hypothetical protein R6U88_07210 [Candidatus Bipolaricaulota bacterium]